jgi:signal transduction histidine kinase
MSMYLHPSAAQAVGAEFHDNALPRLRGRWLLAARVLWLSVALASLGLFVAQIPFAYAGRQIVCAGAACADEYLEPETAQSLQELGLTTSDYAAYVIALDTIFVLGNLAVAAFIFWRKSDERMALFVALALALFGSTWPIAPGLLRNAPATLQALAQIWSPLGFAAFVLLIYIFPDGRFVPRWMRPIALIAIGGATAGSLLPGTRLDPNTWPARLRVTLYLLIFGTLVFTQIYRYTRVSDPVQRQQTKWVVYGVALTIGGGAAYLGLGGLFPAIDQSGGAHLLFFDLIGRTIFGTLTLLIIPLAIGFAILRYRLWDVDPLINRTLVYGALTASVVIVYVLVVSYLGSLFHTESNLAISLVATGLIAVLFQPLRARLQRGVNRLMYGERDDPYAVLSRLSQRLEATLAPNAVLPTIVETIAQTLRLPYVAIALDVDEGRRTTDEDASLASVVRRPSSVVAAHGAPPITLSSCHLVILSYQGETIGQLILATRAPGETFSAADQRLIEDLARQAGVAAHALRLTNDLQRSRERLITAREEERRRLRRDLHDGLGSTLAGLNLQVGALRALITSDPPAADALAVDLRTDIRAAINDVRRLAYELRPPALDELGLVGALRARATQYVGGADHAAAAIQISVDAPEDLPALPAAIEVAAYRIAQEALANVIRHAQAHTCTIRLTLADGLRLEIADDGVGIQAGRGAGVGLVSMRERAAELGGECWIESEPNGGTQVRARLPLS